MKLVGVSGTMAGRKTSQMVFEILRAAKSINPSIETELIDLKDYDVEFMRGYPLSYYNDDTQNVVDKIRSADLVVIGTPVYQASIPGSLKNLLDLLPENTFKGKVVGYISTAGSEKHFLVAEYHLQPIIKFLGGTVPTKNVFVNDEHFDDESVIIDTEILKRIRNFAEEMIQLQTKL